MTPKLPKPAKAAPKPIKTPKPLVDAFKTASPTTAKMLRQALGLKGPKL